MSANNKVIWQDLTFVSNDKIEKWKDEYRNEYPDYSESELYNEVLDDNNMCFEDAKDEIGCIELPDSIICIADLGLWNGRKSGYKELHNFSQCFTTGINGQADVKWYVDDYGEFRADVVHHDGTNNYLYRLWKPECSDSQREFFKNKILSGNFTRKDIIKYTVRLGDYIGEIYGWTFKGRKPSVIADYA